MDDGQREATMQTIEALTYLLKEKDRQIDGLELEIEDMRTHHAMQMEMKMARAMKASDRSDKDD